MSLIDLDFVDQWAGIRTIGERPIREDALSIKDLEPGRVVIRHHTHPRFGDLAYPVRLLGIPFLGSQNSLWIETEHDGYRAELSLADAGVMPYDIRNPKSWNLWNYLTADNAP